MSLRPPFSQQLDPSASAPRDFSNQAVPWEQSAIKSRRNPATGDVCLLSGQGRCLLPRSSSPHQRGSRLISVSGRWLWGHWLFSHNPGLFGAGMGVER